MRRLTRQFRHEVIVVFASLMFASVSLLLRAFHAPGPRDIPVGLVVPSVAEVRDGLSSASPRGFDSPQVATRTAFTRGTIDGALVVAPAHFRLQVAGAAGAGRAHGLTASRALTATHAVSLEDLVPPRAGDSQALSRFFLMLGTLIPSLVARVGSTVLSRRRGSLWAVGTLPAIAVGFGLVLGGITVGLTGLGTYWAVADLVALFPLAVSAATAAVGQSALLALPVAGLVMVVFGLPVSGGAGHFGPFGPGFLRALDSVLPPGAAASVLRDAVYFSRHGRDGRALVLSAFAVAAIMVLAALSAVRSLSQPVNVEVSGQWRPVPERPPGQSMPSPSWSTVPRQGGPFCKRPGGA